MAMLGFQHQLKKIERQKRNIWSVYPGIRIFEDKYNGTSMDRPGFNQLKRAVKRNDIIVSSGVNEGYLQSKNAKKMVVDVPLRLLDGQRADFEIQVAAQDFIIQRAELYSSDMLLLEYTTAADQKKSDLSFSDVHGVMVIVFMRKSPKMFRDYPSKQYIHRFEKMRSDTGMEYSALRKLYFVQLDRALEQFQNGEDAEGDRELQELLALIADINDEQVQAATNTNKELMVIIEEVRAFSQEKEVQSMLLAEKYAQADLNAIKLHERTDAAKVNEERNNKLTNALLELGRIEDLQRSTKDPAFKQELYKEFGIL